jgi:hypothetical protein
MPAEQVHSQAVVHFNPVIQHGTRPIGNADPHKLAKRRPVLQHDRVAVHAPAFAEPRPRGRNLPVRSCLDIPFNESRSPTINFCMT